MKNWAKYFFGSFFSNKIAFSGTDRSVWNGILSFALALIIMLSVSIGGVFAAFPSHYDNSGGFTQFLSKAFADTELRVTDGRAVGGRKNPDGGYCGINTYTDASDAEKYSVNGYGLIVDTRDVSTNYNDFAAVCKDKNGSEIEYSEYRLLSAADKEKYDCKIRYGDSAVNYSQENADVWSGFLAEYKDAAVNEKYKALLVDGKVPESSYVKLYELYFGAYYADLAGCDNFGVAPTMRTYYVDKYLSADDNGNYPSDYLIILQDVIFASWTTDRGVMQSLSGYYPKNELTLVFPSETEIKDFIVACFAACANVVAVNYVINYVSASLILVIVWLIIALIFSAIGWIRKKDGLQSYGKVCKTVGVFSLCSSIPASIVSFILSFFLSRTLCFTFIIAVYCATLLVRTTVYSVYAYKNSANNAENVSSAV